MMRLNEPQYSVENAVDECALGVTGNETLHLKLIASKESHASENLLYANAANAGVLYTIEPVNTDFDSDPVVCDTLKKSELIKIYEQYFRPKNKPARKIYDALLNAAKDKCPFCGGIGTPRNLDHFLPKVHYPQFSILPVNLVPSCRDCNMDGKAQNFASTAGDQIIHPYSDTDRFFVDQWIFSTYVASSYEEPGIFQYYATPPEDWPEFDKQRARKHFGDFDLSTRYATKAAEHLGTVLGQVRSMTQVGLDSTVIQNVLLQPGVDAAEFPNHWQKGMFQALIQHFI